MRCSSNMRRRPTIPLCDWRIAVHLEATRTIQNQPGTPAYACECAACSEWRKHWRLVLPPELVDQLQRVGIDLDHPTDLYAYDRTQAGSDCRVTFHCVGEIQSGPNTWRELPNGSELLHYTTLRGGQDFIIMAIYPHRQSFLTAPAHPMPKQGELIQIDIRLHMPAGS